MTTTISRDVSDKVGDIKTGFNFSCIILAGGNGIRLGYDKTYTDLGGINLLQRVINSLRIYDSEIIIVTSADKTLPDYITRTKCKIVTDILPQKGPLCGIYSGLVASSSTYNLVVAGDMPFLNPGLLCYMLELSYGFDAVVPRLGDSKVDPLHAVYSKNCLSIIKTQLELNQLEVYSIFDTLNVRYLEQAECQRFDPQLLSFFNINYQSDLEQATALTSVIKK